MKKIDSVQFEQYLNGVRSVFLAGFGAIPEFCEGHILRIDQPGKVYRLLTIFNFKEIGQGVIIVFDDSGRSSPVRDPFMEEIQGKGDHPSDYLPVP